MLVFLIAIFFPIALIAATIFYELKAKQQRRKAQEAIRKALQEELLRFQQHLQQMQEELLRIQQEAQQEEARLRTIEMANIDSMDGLAFECYVAWLLQQLGWENVQLTKGSGDFGGDIIATKNGLRYVIQVKRHSGRVSRQAVSDAVAAKEFYKGDVAMVITNSYLSQFALNFAKSTGCVVVDRSKLAEWILTVQSQKNPSTGAERAEDCPELDPQAPHRSEF